MEKSGRDLAQSNSKARHTGAMLYSVSHIGPGSSVLNSVSGPRMYSKIPEAGERKRVVPLPWKVIFIPLSFQVLYV